MSELLTEPKKGDKILAKDFLISSKVSPITEISGRKEILGIWILGIPEIYGIVGS